MDFCLKIVDTVCKVRDKNNRPDFIIGYRLSPEESFDDGITMTETMKLTRELIERPLQYISISQRNQTCRKVLPFILGSISEIE